MSSLCKVLRLVAVLAFFLISSSRVFSQITITSGDLSSMVSSRQVVREDGRASIPVNVGSAGANQTWDFRTMTIANPVLAVSQFLSPLGLPGSNRFPGANLVQKITSSAAAGSEVYNFYRIISSSLANLGDSSKISSPLDTTFVRLRNDILTPLPVAFNNTWRQTKRDTTGFFPLSATISVDTTINTIDAWGTVRLPLGDFACLRIRQNVKNINQIILNGMVFSTTTNTYIQYNWIAKNAFLVARAQSQNNETSPNFTNARGFGLLDSLKGSPSTDVDDTATLPVRFELLQNYPNPFNPETVIAYQTRLDGPVELTVYNLSGKKVRVLVNGIRPAGNYEARWNGTDDSGNRVSSGMYVYRLKSGNFTLSKKMVLLQ